jgi:hypothetical protein
MRKALRGALPSADFDRLIVEVEKSVIAARQAIELEAEGKEHEAGLLWQQLFGKLYPVPEKKETTNAAAAIASPFVRPDIRQAPRFG